MTMDYYGAQKTQGGSKRMIKKLSTVPFVSTKEQDAQLEAVINANKHDKSRLMNVMQETLISMIILLQNKV